MPILCPRCNAPLQSEVYEGVHIDHCQKCRGRWLDHGELVEVLNIREEQFAPDKIEKAISASFAGVPEIEQETILGCPKCSEAMRAVNYAYSSGIIIDRCPRGHGVWLDREEIEKVQIHHEHWAKRAEEVRPEWVRLVRTISTPQETEKSSGIRFFFESMLDKFKGKF